jgi:hypothetical protein
VCAGEDKMTDSNSKWPTPPGLGAAASGVTAASKTMQVFIDELSNLTQKNFEQTTKVMDDLRNARSMSDLLTIQSKFVQDTFEGFNERLRRMSTLMAQLPQEFAQAGQQAMQETQEAMSKSIASITNKTGEPPGH